MQEQRIVNHKIGHEILQRNEQVALMQDCHKSQQHKKDTTKTLWTESP